MSTPEQPPRPKSETSSSVGEGQKNAAGVGGGVVLLVAILGAWLVQGAIEWVFGHRIDLFWALLLFCVIGVVLLLFVAGFIETFVKPVRVRRASRELQERMVARGRVTTWDAIGSQGDAGSGVIVVNCLGLDGTSDFWWMPKQLGDCEWPVSSAGVDGTNCGDDDPVYIRAIIALCIDESTGIGKLIEAGCREKSLRAALRRIDGLRATDSELKQIRIDSWMVDVEEADAGGTPISGSAE